MADTSSSWWDRLAPLLLQDSTHRDCALLCQGGGRLEVHKVLLAIASPLLAEVLTEQEEECKLLLPEEQEELVEELVSWLYSTGGQLKGEVARLARSLGVHTGVEEQSVLVELDAVQEVEVVEEQEEVVVEEEVCMEESTTFLFMGRREEVAVEVDCASNYGLEVSIEGAVVEQEAAEEMVRVVPGPMVCSTSTSCQGSVVRQLQDLSRPPVPPVRVYQKCRGPSPKMQCPSCDKVVSTRHYEKHHRAACTGEVVIMSLILL